MVRTNILQGAFYDELEKIAKKRLSPGERLARGQALAGGAGGAVLGAMGGGSAKQRALQSLVLAALGAGTLYTSGKLSVKVFEKRRKVATKTAQTRANKVVPPKKESKTDKVLRKLPAAGALAGGVVGAASPDTFPAGIVFKGLKSKSKLGRVVSTVTGAGAGATFAGLPAVIRNARN